MPILTLYWIFPATPVRLPSVSIQRFRGATTNMWRDPCTLFYRNRTYTRTHEHNYHLRFLATTSYSDE